MNEFKLISEPLMFGQKVEKLSPDRRRTAKAKYNISRGYHPWGMPLREPRDKTCGECKFALQGETTEPNGESHWQCYCPHGWKEGYIAGLKRAGEIAKSTYRIPNAGVFEIIQAINDEIKRGETK